MALYGLDVNDIRRLRHVVRAYERGELRKDSTEPVQPIRDARDTYYAKIDADIQPGKTGTITLAFVDQGTDPLSVDTSTDTPEYELYNITEKTLAKDTLLPVIREPSSGLWLPTQTADVVAVQVTDITIQTITLPGAAATLKAVTAEAQTLNDNALWNIGDEVWFVGLNAEMPVKDGRYLAVYIGADEDGKPVVATEIASVVSVVKVTSATAQSVTLVGDGGSVSAYPATAGKKAAYFQLANDGTPIAGQKYAAVAVATASTGELVYAAEAETATVTPSSATPQSVTMADASTLDVFAADKGYFYPPNGGKPDTARHYPCILYGRTDAGDSVWAADLLVLPIEIEPGWMPVGKIGEAYLQKIKASGGVPDLTVAYSITSGSTPGGITLAASGDTLTISGTPTATGSVSFKVTATDSANKTAEKTYTLSVTTVSLSPLSIPDGTVSAAYSQTITASGGSGTLTTTYTVTGGSIPAGVSFSASGDTLTISGTPTNKGSVAFSVSATDGIETASGPYTLTINPPALTVKDVNSNTVTVSNVTEIQIDRTIPFWEVTDEGDGAAKLSLLLGAIPDSTWTILAASTWTITGASDSTFVIDVSTVDIGNDSTWTFDSTTTAIFQGVFEICGSWWLCWADAVEPGQNDNPKKPIQPMAGAGPLKGIAGPNPAKPQKLIVVNNGGMPFLVKNNGGDANTCILTPNGDDMQLPAGCSMELLYDVSESAWRVTGGSTMPFLASSSDTTPGYLKDKIATDGDLDVSIENSGANESVKPIVKGLQSYPVSDTAPTDGDSLVYNGPAAKWTPKAASSAITYYSKISTANTTLSTTSGSNITDVSLALPEGTYFVTATVPVYIAMSAAANVGVTADLLCTGAAGFLVSAPTTTIVPLYTLTTSVGYIEATSTMSGICTVGAGGGAVTIVVNGYYQTFGSVTSAIMPANTEGNGRASIYAIKLS